MVQRVHETECLVPDPQAHDHAGDPLRVVREVLRPHRRRHQGVVPLPHHRRRGRLERGEERRVVDGGRVPERVVHRRRCAVRGHHALHHPLDQRGHALAQPRIEGADGPLHRHRRRDHVAREAAVDGPDRDDEGEQRVGVPAHHVLQRRHHLRGHRHRVDRQVRVGGVAPGAHHLDPDRVRRRVRGPEHHAGPARRQPRIDVQRVDRLDRRPLQRAVIDHPRRAGTPLLGRLEQQLHMAPRRPVSRQERGGAQQHRRVAIVPTQVSDARDARDVRRGRLLHDRQRVHVGAQGHRRTVLAAADEAGQPGAARHGRRGLQADGEETLANEGGGLPLGVAQLRVHLEVAAPGHEIGAEGLRGGAQVGGHGGSYRRAVAADASPTMPPRSRHTEAGSWGQEKGWSPERANEG
jgi:hypothetical protein